MNPDKVKVKHSKVDAVRHNTLELGGSTVRVLYVNPFLMYKFEKDCGLGHNKHGLKAERTQSVFCSL